MQSLKDFRPITLTPILGKCVKCVVSDKHKYHKHSSSRTSYSLPTESAVVWWMPLSLSWIFSHLDDDNSHFVCFSWNSLPHSTHSSTIFSWAANVTWMSVTAWYLFWLHCHKYWWSTGMCSISCPILHTQMRYNSSARMIHSWSMLMNLVTCLQVVTSPRSHVLEDRRQQSKKATQVHNNTAHPLHSAFPLVKKNGYKKILCPLLWWSWT